MIVVDSNIIAYLYLPGEFTGTAERLLEREPDWAAPVLWRSEFRNILAGYLRRGSLNFEQANAIQNEADQLLAGMQFDVDSRAVLALVQASRCSAYDCEFVALAMKLGTRLITMDGKLLSAFPDIAMPLTED